MATRSGVRARDEQLEQQLGLARRQPLRQPGEPRRLARVVRVRVVADEHLDEVRRERLDVRAEVLAVLEVELGLRALLGRDGEREPALLAPPARRRAPRSSSVSAPRASSGTSSATANRPSRMISFASAIRSRSAAVGLARDPEQLRLERRPVVEGEDVQRTVVAGGHADSLLVVIVSGYRGAGATVPSAAMRIAADAPPATASTAARPAARPSVAVERRRRGRALRVAEDRRVHADAGGRGERLGDPHGVAHRLRHDRDRLADRGQLGQLAGDPLEVVRALGHEHVVHSGGGRDRVREVAVRRAQGLHQEAAALQGAPGDAQPVDRVGAVGDRRVHADRQLGAGDVAVDRGRARRRPGARRRRRRRPRGRRGRSRGRRSRPAPSSPSSRRAARQARRPSGSRSCGQRLVPSQVPGSSQVGAGGRAR